MGNPFIALSDLNLAAASSGAVPNPIAVTTASGVFVNVVTVAEALLQFCRGRESDFQQEIGNFDVRRAKSRIRSWFRVLFRHARNELTGAYVAERYLRLAQDFLDAPNLNAFAPTVGAFGEQNLLGLLNQMDDGLGQAAAGSPGWWPAHLSVLLKARAIAQALDDIYCEQFTFAFQALNPSLVRVRLEPGMAFPSAPASREFRRPAYRPHTMNDFLSHLRHLRIFPEHAPLNVDVILNDSAATGILRNLGGAEGLLRAGVVCLGPINFKKLTRQFNVRVASRLHVYQSDEVHPEEVPRDRALNMIGMGTFFDVSARASFFDVDDAFKMIQIADREGVRIVIMPELTLDPVRLHLLRDRFLGANWNYVQVLVAGSVHFKDGGAQRNRLFVYFSAGARPFLDPVMPKPVLAEFFHDKVAWFGTRNPAGKRTTSSENDVCFDYEEVARPGVLRVHLMGGRLVGWAICKDVVAHSVSQVFEALGLAYIFVSSLSPTTEDFLVKVATHSVVNNSIVLMAATTSRGQATVVASVPADATLLAIQNKERRSRSARMPRDRHLRPFTLAPTRVVRRSLVKLVIDTGREKPASYRIIRI